MGSLSPPDLEYRRPMDLHSDAVRLCIALQSPLNPGFLCAATHLLSCGTIPPTEFRKHSRKIIRLIETARDRLEASGISLYLFTSCQQPKCTYKAVYFDLLRMLHARRCEVDVALKARTNSLLIRLSSNFVGRNFLATSHVTSATMLLPEKLRHPLAMGITTCTPQPPKSTAPCSSMPAPDAFPPSPALLTRRRKRPRRSEPFSVVPEVVARPRKRARVAADRENQIPVSAPAPVTYVYKAPPLTKRFGIFCTGKTSMHRPRSVRAC
ncbi:hypothetical protein B0H17DRAFT_307850 [Mycena rosella]|uniref:Uncharacterized protein n=1 Tax=Mycena rosella TaxID=1033263 RepID=A0AAD7GPL5_MYCRO|nr:hypothetical protein B0H17DRAFT_307850 [Mycena rosella]